ncbi:hypothetical protein ACFX13_043557 [Malus domestica]|uniref:uncharacterized protein LOC126632600 n=1 Tax=Malus sylvestris TaxID=3752 RepID=UPI0021ACF3FF|nr:uncharacterized protein LOC126632600 [Malus sylvestris]
MESAEAKRISEQEEEVVMMKCYCCGVKEECTPVYVATVKERHQARWICRLCTEVIKYENSRSPRKISIEEALKRHVRFCEEFRKSSPSANPTEDLISAMKQLLRRTPDSPRRERLGDCRPAMVRSRVGPEILEALAWSKLLVAIFFFYILYFYCV